MSRRAVVALLAGGAAVAGVGAIVATGRAPSAERLPGRLDAVVTAGVPGVVVLVEDGSSKWLAARGLADRETARPMRPTDRFRAGSITKTFVAVVVLQLVAEGRIALDDPVARWLPGLVPRGITVGQLLAHTSGLYDYVNDRRTFGEGVSDPRRLVAIALSHPALGLPGERYAYASTNYIVLGLLVERLTGASLGTELARRIFVPLRLRRTAYEPGPARGLQVRGYEAASHDGIVTGNVLRPAPGAARWAGAAGAVVSDARDLATFLGALLGGRLVRGPLLAQMIPERGYGLGVAAFRTPCGTVVGHTGNLLGYVSVAWATPDGRRRVVLMANTFPLAAEAEQAVHDALDAAVCDPIPR